MSEIEKELEIMEKEIQITFEKNRTALQEMFNKLNDWSLT